jgi:branched-chain amino acid transport system ATP-binding protein
LLEVAELQVSYDFLQVVWGASLRIGQGEFVVLLGPNGAGKTTLLRAVAGLLRPKAGEVRFLGRRISGLTADQICRLGISFITEDSNLFTGMSVRENLLLGAYGVADRRKIDDTLAYVFSLFPQLKERAKQMAGTLSGGERKMLAIGRGIMACPKLLLVDEPSLGLAPLTAQSVFRALRELHQRGDTILLVEQNVTTSLQMCQRAYVLEQGRIVLAGTSEALLSNPHVQALYLGAAAPVQ